MKNQFFGDNRDLFKYDLILRVIKEIDSINHFTFIPMLTENDDTRRGEERNRDKAKSGTKNEELKSFLNEFEDKSKRDIKQLESFFKDKITIYKKDDEDKYFFNDFRKRKEYFGKITGKLLQESLILVDPDKGMKEDKSDKEHILYSEVKTLYDRMGRSSILMIFQYIPRYTRAENRENYFQEISKKLRRKVRNLPIYISGYPVVFLFLTKDKSVADLLARTLSAYKECYPELKVGNVS